MKTLTNYCITVHRLMASSSDYIKIKPQIFSAFREAIPTPNQIWEAVEHKICSESKKNTLSAIKLTWSQILKFFLMIKTNRRTNKNHTVMRPSESRKETEAENWASDRKLCLQDKWMNVSPQRHWSKRIIDLRVSNREDVKTEIWSYRSVTGDLMTMSIIDDGHRLDWFLGDL